MKTTASGKKGLYLKVLIACFFAVTLSCFGLSMQSSAGPAELTVIPAEPARGEPLTAVCTFTNPTDLPLAASYELYANGDLMKEGRVDLSPGGSRTVRSSYTGEPAGSEQVHFLVKTRSGLGSHEQMVSVPPVYPGVLAGFISLAAFSTGAMTTMTSREYYQAGFGTGGGGANIGLILTLVLLALLIFMELSSASTGGGTASLKRLRFRFSAVSGILLIIFLGIVFTKVVTIITR